MGGFCGVPGITHIKKNGVRDQAFIHQIKAEQIHHFLDDEQSLFIVIFPKQYLAAGEGIVFRFIGFDFRDGGGFPSPGMVNEIFCVNAEGFI